MKRTLIPDEVRQFILSHIPSVPHLEALLLLRSNPAERWNVSQLAQRLYQSEQAAGDILVTLQAEGIAAENGAPGWYEYRPQTQALHDIVGRLAACYANNLVGVTNLIHSRRPGATGTAAASAGQERRKK